MVATISGVGGTGKTITMLQTASKLYDQQGKEVFSSLITLRLLLTFKG
jgi:CO dehydrogenase nickel-insertion accessory protein CooC1